MRLDEAEARLRDYGGYEWVLSGKQAWSAAEVADQLTQMGISVSKDTVTRWFKKHFPHVQDFGGLGLFVSRNDLIMFLASRIISGAGLGDDATA